MKSKTRFIPLVIIGAILLSLIAVIPAFSATGRVNFLSDVDDLESVVEFTKQGGSFTVLVIDSDLNQSVKNVLIPAQDMTSFQTSLEPIDIGDDGLSITVAGDRTGDLGKDDTVLLSGHTVRRVTSVTLNDGGTPVDASDDTTIIGVNLAVSITAGATETLYEVTNTDATDEKCPTCAEAEGVQLDSAAASFNLNSSPISDSGVGFETVVGVNTEYLHRVTGRTDGDIFREDDILIQLSTDLTTVVVVAALSSEGHVTVAADASRATATYYVSYWGTQFDNTGEAVKITSTADPSGMTLTLNETGRRTGAFSGVVMASGSRTSATTTPPMIKVGESDTIRIAYSDANPSRTTRGSLRVESTSPAFSSLSPAHDVSGRAAQRDLIADVTDGGSGVDDASIQFVVAIGPAGGTIIEDAEIIGGDFVRVRNPQGGSIFNGSALPAATFVGIGDKTVYWWAVAADKAANVAVTDREASKDFLDSGTTNVEGDIVGIEITTASDADKEDLSTVTLDDPCDPDAFLKAAQDDSLDGRNSALSHVTAVDPNTGEVIVLNGVYGCQPFSYSIDASAPQIDRVVTGTFWDDDSDEDDKTEHDSTKAMKTSIYVEFNEDLDPASVDRGDFTIVFTDEDGNTTTATPVNAEVFSGAQHAVFLTVRALDPDAAPTVEVSGIADAAGNSLDDDDQESVDGIAPTITATITGTATANGRAVSDDEISISITVDEPVAAPRVTVYEVEAISAADVEATTNIDESAAAITKVAQRGGTRNAVLQDDGSYLYKFRGSADSLYSALIEADDSQAGNTGKKGDVTLPISVESDTSALLFEIDTKVSDPVITPESTDNLNPFITFDFAAEGKEYTALDEDGDKVDVDSHGTVTIMSATFNGTDIAADLATTDNVQFLYKAEGLAPGEYDVTIEATDQAGNEKEFEGTVEIVERTPYEVELAPGWNLVSIPAETSDSDINAVIGADHPATEVRSYDPSIPGGWLFAVRSNGVFTGTLMNITSGRAYWVLTDSFEGIEVDIPRLSAGSPVAPPTVKIVKGWNMVPVQDVTESRDDISAEIYFSGIEVSRVYTFNTLTNNWDGVVVGATKTETVGTVTTDVPDDYLMVGKGYWVFATEEGTLAP